MKAKKVLIVAAGIAALLCGLVLAIGNYMLEVAVLPDEPRRTDIELSREKVFGAYPEMRQWYDSLLQHGNLRDTVLLDAQGLRHHGLIVEHDSTPQGTSVVMHGYCDNAMIMMRYWYMHYEVLGRNVVVPDHYYHGESDGDHVRFGWLDRHDIAQLWIPLTHQLWPGQQMIVHGLSMGGALTMYTSGEEIADEMNVVGYIEDCGYSSIWDQLKYQLKDEYGLPAWPILHAANMMARWRYGWDMKEADARLQVARCSKPMLFIHGDIDSYVPTHMVNECYAAKTQGYKELWIAPGAEHARSIHDNWQDYVKHCQAFIAKCSE